MAARPDTAAATDRLCSAPNPRDLPRRTEHDREPHAAPFANVRIHRRRCRAVLGRARIARPRGAADGGDRRRRLGLHVGQPRHRQATEAGDGARVAARPAAQPAHRRAHRPCLVRAPPPRQLRRRRGDRSTRRERTRANVRSGRKVERAGQGADHPRLARIRQRHRRRHAGKHRAGRRRPRQLWPGHLRGHRPDSRQQPEPRHPHHRPRLRQAEAGADQLHRATDRRQAVGRAGRCRICLCTQPGGHSRQSAERAERADARARGRRSRRRKAGRRAARALSLGRARGEQCDARQSRALAHHQGRRRRGAGARHPRVDAVREARARDL